MIRYLPYCIQVLVCIYLCKGCQNKVDKTGAVIVVMILNGSTKMVETS